MRGADRIRPLTGADRFALRQIAGRYHVGMSPQFVAFSIARDSFDTPPHGHQLAALLTYAAFVHQRNIRSYSRLMNGF
jgi:hypothetical protein